MEWILYITIASAEPIKSKYEFQTLAECSVVGDRFSRDMVRVWNDAGLPSKAGEYVALYSCSKK